MTDLLSAPVAALWSAWYPRAAMHILAVAETLFRVHQEVAA